MGHRLISALIFLNALGLVLCAVLITAAVSSDEPARVVQVSEAVRILSPPVCCWGGTSHRGMGNSDLRIRSVTLEKEIVEICGRLHRSDYFFDCTFVIAGWRLPQAFITGLQISR